ncbi:hypothetical protein Hanom_Chr13g01184431 [Helianthus anomalus]
MIEKYQSCRKELESTQINCEKWVEPCVGFEMLFNKQTKSNVKFGIGYKESKSKNSKENENIDSYLVEVIPTNSVRQRSKNH